MSKIDQALPLTCAKPNKRPRLITDEMARRAAEQIAQSLVSSGAFSATPFTELADDIMEATKFDRSMDAYELARALDDQYGWSPDAGMVDELDGFSFICDSELRQAEKAWAAENPMEPPIPVGTVIKTPYGPGVIECVYEHGAHSYLVFVEGARGKPVIRFEDAEVA